MLVISCLFLLFAGFEFGNKVNYIKAHKLLFSMRSMCLKAKPEVNLC